MAWFSDLAGKAENLLNNLDEQTGAALRSSARRKTDRSAEHSPPPSRMNLNNPPWNANSKRRPALKPVKKPVTETKSNYNSRVNSPNARQSRAPVKETVAKETKLKLSKSPGRKSVYNIDNCPTTLVGDLKAVEPVDTFGLRHRRYSLPTDLDITQDDIIIKMQNLEVENAMLKQELNVTNREVSDLLDRLRVTEDGNDVVSDEELHRLNLKLASTECVNNKVENDKTSLTSQLNMLKQKVNDLTSVEIAKYREQSKGLQFEIDMLRGRNKDLEDLIRQMNERTADQDAIKARLENELKHAQTTINDLESDLERTTAECRRLESEWDSYKLRVKAMLFNKDKEIKALQEGLNLTEDTKILIEQIELLKDEREELSEAVSHVRGECSEMRRHVEEMEARRDAAERVVAALRDALREERDARTRAEAQCAARRKVLCMECGMCLERVAAALRDALRDERDARTCAEALCAARRKELKELETDTNLTITSLRAMLRDKDYEISRLREASVRSVDTSALNVADYDLQESIDHDKIHYLTQTLVQKQGKIDSLLADNNMLKIQMEKLETKYRSELCSLRTQMQRHSVVNVDEGRRSRAGESALTGFSRRLGVALKRHPVMRVFMMFYMLALHFWVLTVLLTSTPEGFGLKQKSIPNEA